MLPAADASTHDLHARTISLLPAPAARAHYLPSADSGHQRASSPTRRLRWQMHAISHPPAPAANGPIAPMRRR
jgi:hypothetical protein